jgi:hypothetical protein
VGIQQIMPPLKNLMTPAAQQLRERMDKWDFIKLKSFCKTKEMV